MDPLAKAYLKVITEDSEDLQKGQTVAGYTPQVGDAPYGDTKGKKNAEKFIKNSGPEAADDIESPEEAPRELQQQDGELEKNSDSYAESNNPFDLLFAKILKEEGENMMDFSTSGTPEDSTFEPSSDEDEDHGYDEEDDTDDSDDSEESDEVTITLDRETAEKLIDILQAAIGGGEGEDHDDEYMEDEDHDGEDMGDEDHEDENMEGEENPFKEATDLEEFSNEHGLRLVDKGNKEVKGAVPVTKKSAQTPKTGKGHDGKLKPCSTEGGVSKLTSKSSYDVGGVKVGKTIFDNE